MGSAGFAKGAPATGWECSRRMGCNFAMANVESELAALTQKLETVGGQLETEEATKNAIIMPLLSRVLGFDVFDPNEVIPEFTCDVGTARGSKIDYALLVEGVPAILIEAKKFNSKLSINGARQLKDYYSRSDARIGILTNGREWRLYADLEKENIMDDEPFFVFDLLESNKETSKLLPLLAKDTFDGDGLIKNAAHRRLRGKTARLILKELSEPSDEFVKLFGRQVIEGSMSTKKLERFRGVFEEAIKEALRASASRTLADEALAGPAPEVPKATPAPAAATPEKSKPEPESEVVSEPKPEVNRRIPMNIEDSSGIGFEAPSFKEGIVGYLRIKLSQKPHLEGKLQEVVAEGKYGSLLKDYARPYHEELVPGLFLVVNKSRSDLDSYFQVLAELLEVEWITYQ